MREPPEENVARGKEVWWQGTGRKVGGRPPGDGRSAGALPSGRVRIHGRVSPSAGAGLSTLYHKGPKASNVDKASQICYTFVYSRHT